MEGKMKISAKHQFFATIVLTFIMLIIMVSHTFISFYSNAVSDMEAVGKSCLAQETEQIEGYLTKGMDVLQVTAIMVEYMMQNGAGAEEIKDFLTEESKRYTEEIDENFTGIYGVFNGEYIDGIGWVPDAGYVPQDREWYVAAVRANGMPTLVSPYLDAQTGTIMMSVSQLLYDNESVISFDIALNRIQVITHDIGMGEMGYGFIVDGDGLVVAHNDEGEKGKNYLEDSEMKSLMDQIYIADSDSFEREISGEKCTVFIDTIMNDWSVAMIISNTRLFYEIRMIMIQNAIICFIVFGLIVLFCGIAFRRIQRSAKAEQESQRKLEQMNVNIVRALARTIDAKDRYTNGHSQRVANYSVELAKRLGKTAEEQSDIYYAGLLHDVGKIRVPEEVINKPGKLTDEEFEQIKIHPVTGYHILKDIFEDKKIAIGAKFHHERYDGTGYPNGLMGENIPEIARIIGVADAYDAMASNRSYRSALSQEVVRSEIVKGKGKQFDPKIADAMLQMIDEDHGYTMKQSDSTEKVILVVDDESINIKMVQYIIGEEPTYQIISACDGRQALEILEKRSVDLILLDVRMPDMDGFETLQHIRENHTMPVVFMTGNKDRELLRKVSDLGVDDYLTKPFMPLVLKEVVHSILNV